MKNYTIIKEVKKCIHKPSEFSATKHIFDDYNLAMRKSKELNHEVKKKNTTHSYVYYFVAEDV